MKSTKKTVKLLIAAIMMALVLACACGCGADQSDTADTITYNDSEYCLLEFEPRVFTYYPNTDETYEEDVMYEMAGEAGMMVYYCGDLYCSEDQLTAAEEYYADDANYDWYITVENDESEQTSSIELTDEEIAYIEDIESLEQDASIFVDEIEAFGTLTKVSKDEAVCAIINLAHYDGSWYWRSGIIDESEEADGTWPEYVQLLPETLCAKIEM